MKRRSARNPACPFRCARKGREGRGKEGARSSLLFLRPQEGKEAMKEKGERRMRSSSEKERERLSASLLLGRGGTKKEGRPSQHLFLTKREKRGREECVPILPSVEGEGGEKKKDSLTASSFEKKKRKIQKRGEREIALTTQLSISRRGRIVPPLSSSSKEE